MRKSNLQSRIDPDTASTTTGECRLIYGDDGEFDVFAIRLADAEHERDWEMLLTYPTAGVWPNGVVKRAKWTSELLMEAMQPTFRKVRSVYGGDWVLDIRRALRIVPETERRAGALAAAEQRIMDGPDTPGRRWLVRNRGKPAPVTPILKPVPALPKPVRVADTGMIDRLKKAVVPAPSAPLQADEDWFNEESVRLREEEPPVTHVPAGEEIPF